MAVVRVAAAVILGTGRPGAARAAPARQGLRRLLGVSRRQARARRVGARRARPRAARGARTRGRRRGALARTALHLSARRRRAQLLPRVRVRPANPSATTARPSRWQTPGRFDVAPLLPANTAILRALELPPVCGVIPTATLAAPSSPTILRRALDRRLELIRIDIMPGVGDRRAVGDRTAGPARGGGRRTRAAGWRRRPTPGPWAAPGCTGPRPSCARRRRGRPICWSGRPAPTPRTSRTQVRWGSISSSWSGLRRARRTPPPRHGDGPRLRRRSPRRRCRCSRAADLARTDLAFAQRQGAHGVALVIGAG